MHSTALRRHFVRQLLGNDLLSPDADRHDVLSTAAAALVTAGLFVSVLISVKYLFRPFQSPVWTQVTLMDDMFLFSAWSMLLMALVAVIEWNALGLDARDTANMGLLPIRPRDLARAKLTAVGLFALAFGLALNGVAAVVHPLLMTVKLDVGLTGAVILIAAHLITTLAAGVFGFSIVMGVREMVHVFLHERIAAPVARAAQVAMFTICATAFLLAPAASFRVVDVAASGSALRLLPPIGFVAVHRALTQRVFDRVPRRPLPRWPAELEAEAVREAGRSRSALRALAAGALVALGVVFTLAIAAYALNSRRLPSPATSARRHRSAIWSALVSAGRPSRGDARAAYLLATKTLARSAPHRFAVAAAIAVGAAAAAGCLRAGVPLQIQTYFIVLLLVGVRHALSLPADPEAGWIFQAAWGGDTGAFRQGLRRACLAAIVMPALFLLVPLNAWLLGWRIAGAHALVGLALGGAGCAAIARSIGTLPLVAAHEPSDTLRVRFPVYIVALVVAVYAFAWAEREAFVALRIWH